MKPNIKPWQLLSISYNDKLQDTLLQQYHAAQFLAIAGRYLIPQQADDSNTSLVFLPEKQELAGQELQTDNRLVLNEVRLSMNDNQQHAEKTYSHLKGH